MNKTQEAYNSMAHKTIGELQRHSDIWTGNTIITNTVATINQIFVEIDETNARQNRKSTGLTQKKNEFREQLNNTTDVFLGIFRSYAKTIGDDELYENSNMSISEIKKIKDTEIMVTVNTAKTYATDHLLDLANYGMNQTMITDYQTQADGFVEYLTKPQEIIAERKTATAHLKVLLKQLDEQLTEYLDNHMMQYKTTQPQFYHDYENARIIFDDPTISKSLMGTVTDQETGLPLQYVEVTATFSIGPDTVEFTKTTTQKGNYQFKGLPEGQCTVTFQKNYYNTLTLNSEIHNNAMTRLNAAIQRTN